MISTLLSPFCAVYKLYHRQGTPQELQNTHTKIMGISAGFFILRASAVRSSGEYFEYISRVPPAEWCGAAWVITLWWGVSAGLLGWTLLMKDLPDLPALANAAPNLRHRRIAEISSPGRAG